MVNWKENWNKLSSATENVHKQVGRTGNSWDDAGMLKATSDHIISQLKPANHHHLLDVCCGNAYLTSYLKPHFNKITGIDISSVQIEHANARQIPGTEFIVSDAANMKNISSETFDRVLCYFSFQYFDSFKKGKLAISEMSRVLKDGGCIFIGDIPDKNKKWTFYKS